VRHELIGEAGVGVLLAALAMERGFRATIDGSASDADEIAIRAGANSELDSVVPVEQARLVETAPAIARGASGVRAVSAETYTTVDGLRRDSGMRVNLPLRGVGSQGPGLRDGFRLIAGRMFASGSNELIVGDSAAREFVDFEVGREIAFGTTRWRIVGRFTVPGTIFDSEVWGDIRTVQSYFGRGPSVQTIRMRLAAGSDTRSLASWIFADPRLRLDVTSERAFARAQSQDLSNAILWLGWPLALAIAVGALAGSISVTYSSVKARAREIATLRAVGFSGRAALVATLVESTFLAGIGGLAGTSAAWLMFDGRSAATLGSNFSQVVFSFAVTPDAILTGGAIALVIGFLGGIGPAVYAAKATISNVHRASS